jgi:HK97 family phage portal protein
VVGYQLYINTVTTFGLNEIMHDKFANLDYDGVGSQLYGQSPLHAGSKLLTKSNSQKQYEVSILQNGGHFGVMSMKEQAGATYEELLTQSDLLRAKLRSVKGPENGGSIFITPTDVQFTPISMSAKDMEINQAYWNDVRGFCNMYGVPSRLLNDPDNKSYNSLIEAEKALTVRATSPHLNSLRNNFNRKLYSDWGGVKDRIVDYDLNCYPELQKNKKELMDWISKAPISIERTYELLGEPVPDWMDEETRRTILVPQNLVPLGEAPIDLSNDPYGK